MQENLNNVEKTNKAQPLVLSNQQATPATPPNIENFPSVPSSQDLPVVIVSPKNPNPQNDNIVSIPKSDEMFYKDLLPKQRILWQEQFAKNMIEEFMKFNNISEESVRNLDIVVKNLLKIMHNPEALLKFMNDMFQAAQKSDSNHQDPFLTIMYGEEKSGELSSNSKIVNISTESYLKLLDQIFFYISVTDPLRHDYMTRGVAETIDEDGNKVTNFLTTQQMEQEEEHEIQKNQYDKALFSKFGKGTSNLRDIYFIIQNIRQNGFRQDHLKAIVGGESLPEIILKLPKTILRHAVKITEITINNATNAENYMMAAHGAKIMLGYGTQSAQNLITGIKPLLSLTGGDKADEPIALKPQSGLMGIRGFWQGKLGVGANLLGNFRWNENAPPVPTDEETKEESVEKTPVVLNPLSDSGVSGGNPINAEISTANTTETPEAQDSLIPSASGPSENPEGQQKLGIAVVGEKLGEVVGGKFGKIIGRSIARFAENVIETSRRNAEKQHVKSDDDSSGQCDDRSNNDNPDFPSDDITNPSDEQIQQEEEIVGGNVNDDCTQSSFQATLYYTNNPFDLFS
jgi:hypothetical protein